MPVTPIKNLIYRVGMTALRPLNNRHLCVQGADFASLHRVLRRRQMHRATIMVSQADRLQTHVTTGIPTPPPTNAYYHVASIAKMVTAVGALQMVQRGQLSLHEPMIAYSRLPIPPEVTLEHLLAHTSGIIDGPGYGSAVAQRIPLNELLARDGFLSSVRPGERFQYSNLAFGIVGSLIEEISGQSLDEYMKEHLFHPWGIDATYDLTSLSNEAHLVSCRRHFPPSRGFALDGPARLKAAQPLSTSDPLHHYGLAAGGLFMTAEGLLKWMQHLFVDQTLLSPSLLETMLTPRSVNTFKGYRCGFGLGMFCLESLTGHKVYGHQGFAYGAVQGAFWSPETNRLLVSLNGGADESRRGRLGVANLDLINLTLGGSEWIL